MNASLLVLCLVLLSAVCCVLSQRSECEPHVLDSCVSQLKSLYIGQDGPVIVKSESELQTGCGHLQQASFCINNYVDTCFDDEHRNDFYYKISGVQELISAFCNPESPTRKVYVKHLSCLNEVSDHVNHCTRRLEEEWKVKRKEMKLENITRGFCWQHDQTMSCIRTIVGDRCSDEAADLYVGMIYTATKPLMQSAGCSIKNYTISENNGSSSLTASVLALASLISVVLTV